MSEQQPSLMRSLANTKYCTPSEYELSDLPVPGIKNPDDILIKVHAASINPVDVKVATGKFKQFVPSLLPFKIGYDVSGVVVAAGSEVPSHLQPGAEVFSRVPEEHRGTASQYVTSTVSTTSIKPQSISHIQAASVPLAALTSLQAFDIAESHFEGGLKGKTVYIPGGLSGTGSIAVQLAKNVFKADRVITTLSPSKIAKVETLLGSEVIDQIVDYTKEDPGRVIEGGCVDFMYDIIGTAMSSLHLMKKGGIIITVTSVPFGKSLERVPGIPLVFRGLLKGMGAFSVYRAKRYGVEYQHLFITPSALDLDRLRDWIDQGLIKPVVGRIASLGNLQDVRDGCLEVFNGKGGTGKFVIQVVGNDGSSKVANA